MWGSCNDGIVPGAAELISFTKKPSDSDMPITSMNRHEQRRDLLKKTAYFPSCESRSYSNRTPTLHSRFKPGAKTKRSSRSMDDALSDIETVHRACKEVLRQHLNSSMGPSRDLVPKVKARPNTHNNPLLFTFRGDSSWLPKIKFPRHVFPIKNKLRY